MPTKLKVSASIAHVIPRKTSSSDYLWLPRFNDRGGQYSKLHQSDKPQYLRCTHHARPHVRHYSMSYWAMWGLYIPTHIAYLHSDAKMVCYGYSESLGRRRRSSGGAATARGMRNFARRASPDGRPDTWSLRALQAKEAAYPIRGAGGWIRLSVNRGAVSTRGIVADKRRRLAATQPRVCGYDCGCVIRRGSSASLS